MGIDYAPCPVLLALSHRLLTKPSGDNGYNGSFTEWETGPRKATVQGHPVPVLAGSSQFIGRKSVKKKKKKKGKSPYLIFKEERWLLVTCERLKSSEATDFSSPPNKKHSLGVQLMTWDAQPDPSLGAAQVPSGGASILHIQPLIATPSPQVSQASHGNSSSCVISRGPLPKSHL